jgi:hypothetical protein
MTAVRLRFEALEPCLKSSVAANEQPRKEIGAPRQALSGAWNVRIAGRTATCGSLDLTHLERHQMRFNFNF